MNMEQRIEREAVEKLRKDVSDVHRAVFGDPANPKQHPGMVSELKTFDANLSRMNDTLEEMRGDFRRVMWAILAGVGSVVLGIIVTVLRASPPTH